MNFYIDKKVNLNVILLLVLKLIRSFQSLQKLEKMKHATIGKKEVEN